ncbi:MAG: hypothetical protein KAW09_11040, partial [Thermoplasmata archaeon]|nr:hypothetical protein [Thermoplasmata archaeon]
DFIWAGGLQSSGREMTEDKGRLLLAEDEMHAALRRMNGGWLIAFIWIFGAMLLFAGVLLDGPVNMLIALIPGVLLIVSGLVGAYLTTKIRTISLHENGIDNLRVSYTTVRFATFDEVESADIYGKDDWATIHFWVKGRRLKPLNPLYVRKEDVQKERLNEILDFLRSKGVKVNLTDQAGEWLGEEG